MTRTTTTPKILSDDEVKRILIATGRAEDDFRDHMVLLVALTTGLRVSELVALDISDIKNGRGVKTVVPLRVTKGGRPGEIVIPERTRRKLVAYLAWKERHGESVADEAPLFVSRGGGRSHAPSGSRLSVRATERLFTVWQKRAGFDRHHVLHSTRHTYATKCLRSSGGNLRVVQAACRHANIATTVIYTHVTTDDVARAADNLGW